MPTVTIVGAGVIGLSWAKLFANKNWNIVINDPQANIEQKLNDIFPHQAQVSFEKNLAKAVQGTDFVQENGPENITVKKEIFQTLAEHAPSHAILASSSSSILPSTFSHDNSAAHRIIIGHPFNPPEIMPLVEVVPSPATSTETIDKAIKIYQQLGKTPVRIKKEIEGFIGNRLQTAIIREAYWLAENDYIEPQDLDTVIKNSLGLRWAVTGVFEANHLGGGPGGIRHIIEHIFPALAELDLHKPNFDKDKTEKIIDTVEATYGGKDTYEHRVQRRDKLTQAVLETIKKTDQN